MRLLPPRRRIWLLTFSSSFFFLFFRTFIDTSTPDVPFVISNVNYLTYLNVSINGIRREGASGKIQHTDPVDDLETTVKRRGTTTQKPRWASALSTREIDAVISYVNGSEETFRAGVRAALSSKSHAAAFAGTKNRFQDHDDLKILLRSMDKFGQMFRQIFLVVADAAQIPVWLNRENDRIKIVFHKDIWNDPSQLPVFNSLAIEANLHHIPGLSEAFVYFNDDIALTNKISASDFFASIRKDPQKKSIKIRTNIKIADDYGAPATSETHWVGPAITTRNAVNELCPVTKGARRQILAFGAIPNHVPHLLLRSVLYHAERNPFLQEHFQRTSGSKLRSGHEINTVMLFNSYAQCVLKLAVYWSRRMELFYVGVDTALAAESDLTKLKADFRANARRIRSNIVKFMCVNDVSDSGNVTAIGRTAAEYVYSWRLKQFPTKSSFET